jgi:hypothetical protein
LEQLESEIDSLAAKVSEILEAPDTRIFIVNQIEAAKLKALPLGDLATAALGQNLGEASRPLTDLVVRVRRVEVAMAAGGVPTPRIDIKLPVKQHHGKLGNSDAIYVLAAPFEDESEVKSLPAYNHGERIVLDAAEPPRIPTLVILPAESESLDPTYPLQFSDEPGEEENPRKVDDFVGVPKIWIEDDHESWASGDPEIYLNITRIQRTGAAIDALLERFDLPGVNGEQVWYDLGDSNVTYRYVDIAGFTPYMTFSVYEDDNFAHGADDFLGSVQIEWNDLDVSSYTTFIVDDAQLKIDRD